MRVGIGYEIHPFDPRRVLMLGGVKVEGAWGLRGPGDADVVLRAVVDALLGAAGLGDLGDHFPADDPDWARQPSAVLLAETLPRLAGRGLAASQVDVTVVAERPALAPWRAPMRTRIAALLGLPEERVNVKAVGADGLGALGRAEGIAALAVACLQESAA
jgi:2-C-methyl-D-erythritol 2,4-cyclodiphosphate synthase